MIMNASRIKREGTPMNEMEEINMKGRIHLETPKNERTNLHTYVYINKYKHTFLNCCNNYQFCFRPWE